MVSSPNFLVADEAGSFFLFNGRTLVVFKVDITFIILVTFEELFPRFRFFGEWMRQLFDSSHVKTTRNRLTIKGTFSFAFYDGLRNALKVEKMESTAVDHALIFGDWHLTEADRRFFVH